MPSLSRLPWAKIWKSRNVSDVLARHGDDEWEEGSHLVGTIHGGKGIGVDALAHCELMRDLEQRRHAEDLGEVGANTGKHGVVEEDIALDLLGQGLYRAWVAETELGPALGEGVDDISYCGRDGVGEEKRAKKVDSGGHDGREGAQACRGWTDTEMGMGPTKGRPKRESKDPKVRGSVERAMRLEAQSQWVPESCCDTSDAMGWYRMDESAEG